MTRTRGQDAPHTIGLILDVVRQDDAQREIRVAGDIDIELREDPLVLGFEAASGSHKGVLWVLAGKQCPLSVRSEQEMKPEKPERARRGCERCLLTDYPPEQVLPIQP